MRLRSTIAWTVRLPSTAGYFPPMTYGEAGAGAPCSWVIRSRSDWFFASY